MDFEKSFLVIVVITTIGFMGCSWAYHHIVGESIWSIPLSQDFYKNWSSSHTFRVGDSLGNFHSTWIGFSFFGMTIVDIIFFFFFFNEVDDDRSLDGWNSDRSIASLEPLILTVIQAMDCKRSNPLMSGSNLIRMWIKRPQLLHEIDICSHYI